MSCNLSVFYIALKLTLQGVTDRAAHPKGKNCCPRLWLAAQNNSTTANIHCKWFISQSAAPVLMHLMIHGTRWWSTHSSSVRFWLIWTCRCIYSDIRLLTCLRQVVFPFYHTLCMMTVETEMSAQSCRPVFCEGWRKCPFLFDWQVKHETRVC